MSLRTDFQQQCAKTLQSTKHWINGEYVHLVHQCMPEHLAALMSSKEGRTFLFNDAHMIKDHSDSEREKTRYRHMGYSF